MKQRRLQREAATAAMKPGAATAHLTFERKCKSLAVLEEQEAVEVMKTNPTRTPQRRTIPPLNGIQFLTFDV